MAKEDISKQDHDRSRREFVKGMGKAAYAAPLILTLHAMPSFAQTGSGPVPCSVDPTQPRCN